MWLTTIIIFAEGFLVTAYESVINEKSFFVLISGRSKWLSGKKFMSIQAEC